MDRELKRISEKPDLMEGTLSICKTCGQKIKGLFARSNKKAIYKLIDMVPHVCFHIRRVV